MDSESNTESLTSTNSEDLLFFDDRKLFNDCSSTLVRSDVNRKNIRRKTVIQNSFVVNNLSQQEIDLETNEDDNTINTGEDCLVQANAENDTEIDRSTDSEIYIDTGRKRRCSRRDIDYKHFNSFGFQ